MGYYTRAFCKSVEIPTIKEIMDYLNLDFEKAYTNLSNEELESPDWSDFELFYDEKKSPILVEINRINDLRGLAKEEIEEFKEAIGKPKLLELRKRKVIKHLNDTKYIICNRLLASDIDDDGYEVNWCVLGLFNEKYDGLTQADDVGIYIDEKYLIKV